MQYIQLQGQVAETLDLPIEGGFNLFIDTSDNSIKAKDFEGTITGGGGLSLIEVTREEVGQLVLSASLTPGAFYKITGVASASFYDDREWSYTGMGNEIQDGGTTIILQAATDKTLSKKGIGLFYVPNYENPQYPTAAPDNNYKVWDPTSRLYFNNLSGLFDHNEPVQLYSDNEGAQTDAYIVANTGYNSLTIVYDGSSDKFLNDSTNLVDLKITGYNSNASASIVDYEYTSSYNTGDCVIWGGRVWENRSGSIGYYTGGWPLAQLQLNEQDWTVVPFNETNYTIVADLIEYEFEYDNISYRKSANNVEVTSTWKIWDDYWGYNMIKYFPWGHTQIQNISISNSYLDAFINYPHDAYASEIKFADYGGFNAHYWGHNTAIYNISSEQGGHMVSLNLGYSTQIYNIKLGLDSRLSDIYTYDNDNSRNALHDITIGDRAKISDNWNPIYMYSNSYMSGLELDTYSEISDINLYPYSCIRDTKLGIDSYIATIALGNYSDFRQVELGNSSHIEYINTNVSACFKRVKIGIDSYIEYMAINTNGYFKHIEMADESQMTCILIGNNSFFRYVNLGIRSSIYAIEQTAGNSYFEYINVGIDSDIGDIEVGSYSYFTHINTGINSGIYSIYQRETFTSSSIINEISSSMDYTIPSTGSGFDNINTGINCNISNITMGSNTSLNNFEVGNEGGFSYLILSQSAELNRFKIGQDYGFGQMVFSSSLSDVTIERGFNNFNANVFQVTGSTNTSYTPVDYQNAGSTLDNSKSFHLIDISGQSTTLSWYLDDGIYEGQEVTFLLKNDGTAEIGSTQVWIFLNTLRSATGNLQTSYPWYPFEKDTNQNTWRNTAKAIWIDGAWNVDNSMYD